MPAHGLDVQDILLMQSAELCENREPLLIMTPFEKTKEEKQINFSGGLARYWLQLVATRVLYLNI